MTTNAHTPTPWEVGDLDHNGQRIVRGEHIEICTCWHHCVGSIEKEMEANAAFIVRAVNAYEGLVAALSGLLAANDAVELVLCNGPDVPGFDPTELGRAQVRVTRAEDVARAVLAKLEAAS